jgi:hypothetical protein
MPEKIAFKRISDPVLTDGMRQQNHFIPALMAKIKQSYFQVSLRFTSGSLVLSEMGREIEYEDGRFLARSFLRAGVRSLILKEFPSWQQLRQLNDLLGKAEEGRIEPLLAVELSKIEAVAGIEEVTGGEEVGAIPGCYKHYTSFAGYQKIVQGQKIEAMPHRKNGEVREGVYLTGLSLSQEEAHRIVFIGNPEYADRSSHVIAFDIVDPEMAKQVKKKGIEYFFAGEIDLRDPRIRVAYFGPNRLQVAA